MRFFPFFNSEWRIGIIRYMLSLDEGKTLRDIWVYVNESGDRVGRAQVINFLDCLQDLRLVESRNTNDGKKNQRFYQLSGLSRELFERLSN